MVRTDAVRNVFKRRIIIATLVAAVMVTAGMLFLFHGSAARSEKGKEVNGGLPAMDAPDLGKMSREDIEEAQKAAALAAVTGKPVSGRVTQRPSYVSSIEWEVFRNIVKERPGEGEAQLAALVNKLLFFKKKEAWESSGTPAGRRRDLARDLLQMLPFMTGGKHIDTSEARRLEGRLNDELRMAQGD